MSNPFGPGQSGPGDQNPYGQQPPPQYGGQQPPQYGGQQPYPQQPGGPPPQQPYGGQPPYPQQPGQQPYPPQQPYPQQYPGAPMGYMEPRRRKKWPWIVGGIVGLVVILGVIGYVVGKDSAANAKPGDCITAKAKDPKITDCGDANAAFRVIENFEDSSDRSKCDAPEITDKGAILSVRWKGGNDGVLCLTITKNTTSADFSAFQASMPQGQLDELREELAAAGIEGVK
ncbi:LppU/SCO3897 family protein [Streptodolium elevatio]